MKNLIFLGGILFVSFIIYTNYPKICFGNECTAIKSKQSEIIESAKRGEILLIDVREKEEWDSGHIEGAIFLPLGNINEASVSNFPKDKPTYIYCRSGRRAGAAIESLKTLGFINLKNMGGIIEWQEKGGVLVK